MSYIFGFMTITSHAIFAFKKGILKLSIRQFLELTEPIIFVLNIHIRHHINRNVSCNLAAANTTHKFNYKFTQ